MGSVQRTVGRSADRFLRLCGSDCAECLSTLLGDSPGGFRVWWRRLTGSDEHLDNTQLMRTADRFARRIGAFGKAHDVPVVDCGRRVCS
jgi:hypothetical protein